MSLRYDWPPKRGTSVGLAIGTPASRESELLRLRRLEIEISKSKSPIDRPNDTRKGRTAGICRRLQKYNTLNEKERSAKRLVKGTVRQWRAGEYERSEGEVDILHFGPIAVYEHDINGLC